MEEICFHNFLLYYKYYIENIGINVTPDERRQVIAIKNNQM